MSGCASCTHTELANGLQSLLQKPGPHYVVFSSDAPDGVYWCPDCVRALPAIKRTAEEKGASLLEVFVGPRSVWKDPQHPLRHDPVWRLDGVPSLYSYSAAGPGRKLGGELESAGSPAEVVALTARFIDDTR